MNIRSSLLLSCLFAPAALAQGLYVGPDVVVPPVDHQVTPRIEPAVAVVPANEPARLSVSRTTVRASIDDGACSTEIEQTFHNGFAREMEATWMLPLPAGAMADGFSMMVGDKLMTGEVLDARTARGVYEQIVRQRRDPGLLEYAGAGLLRARVFPIPPHGDCTVKVRFRQLLTPTGGLYEWSWPLRAAGLGDGGAGVVGIDLQIRSQTPIKTVLATLPGAEIVRKGEHEARVGLELKGGAGQLGDLRVLYGLSEQDFGLHLLPFRRAGEDGYFAMMLAPRRDWDSRRLPHECVQFAIDTSGSMRGKKIEQARAALRGFVQALRDGDWFDIVPFSTEARPFFGAPRPANAANVAEALRRIDELKAEGGTNIGDALKAVLQAPPAGEGDAVLLPIVLFVTDGAPTVGEVGMPQLLALGKQQNQAAARLFVFGVGNDVNTALLDQLAAANHGARDYVRENEDIEVKTSALMQKVAMPVLTDVEVRCPELDGFDVFPRVTGDLFAGETLQLVGRYRGEGQKTLVVRGKVGGAVREYEFSVGFPAQSTRFDFVPALWAQKKVIALLDQIRLHGAQQELLDEVTRLSREFGITTPYTSHLILEEGMRLGAQYRGLADGAPGGRFSGPGDVTPPSPGGGRGTGGAAGPTTRGPAGPATPGPTGPATGRGPTTGGRGVSVAEPDLQSQLSQSRKLLERANWPTTGEQAVQDSVQTGGDEFFLAATKASDSRAAKMSLAQAAKANTRRVGDRTFYKVGERWVESGLPADWDKQATKVPAFSKDYFDLLTAHPELKDVLALGKQVVLKLGKQILSITE